MERDPFSAKNQIKILQTTEYIFRLRVGIISSYSNRSRCSYSLIQIDPDYE